MPERTPQRQPSVARTTAGAWRLGTRTRAPHVRGSHALRHQAQRRAPRGGVPGQKARSRSRKHAKSVSRRRTTPVAFAKLRARHGSACARARQLRCAAGAKDGGAGHVRRERRACEQRVLKVGGDAVKHRLRRAHQDLQLRLAAGVAAVGAQRRRGCGASAQAFVVAEAAARAAPAVAAGQGRRGCRGPARQHEHRTRSGAAVSCRLHLARGGSLPFGHPSVRSRAVMAPKKKAPAKKGKAAATEAADAAADAAAEAPEGAAAEQAAEAPAGDAGAAQAPAEQDVSPPGAGEAAPPPPAAAAPEAGSNEAAAPEAGPAAADAPPAAAPAASAPEAAPVRVTSRPCMPVHAFAAPRFCAAHRATLLARMAPVAAA